MRSSSRLGKVTHHNVGTVIYHTIGSSAGTQPAAPVN
jgi:hypothetical protein